MLTWTRVLVPTTVFETLLSRHDHDSVPSPPLVSITAGEILGCGDVRPVDVDARLCHHGGHRTMFAYVKLSA